MLSLRFPWLRVALCRQMYMALEKAHSGADKSKSSQRPRRSAGKWQIAVHCFIDVAEGRDFIMHARISVLQALNRNKPKAIVERRKAAKKYRIVR